MLTSKSFLSASPSTHPKLKKTIYYSVLTITLFILILAISILRIKIIKKAEFKRNLKKNEIPVLKKNSSPTFLNLFQISPNLFTNVEKEKEEVEIKEDDKLCIVCYSREHNTIFDPCGHGGACDKCVGELWRSGKKECPLCREVTCLVLVYVKMEDGRFLQVDEIE